MFRLIGCFIALLLLFTLGLPAQDSPRLRTSTQQAPQDDDLQKVGNKDFTINVNVALVTLPVSVVDREGKLVDNLSKDQFQVYEDNVLQEISLFKHEDTPLSVGLVIDNSGSM